MKLKLYISLIFSFITLLVNAQDANLTAKVSKNELGVNQRLRIEFKINKQGSDNFKPPNFKNFEIISGPSQSTNQFWTNGEVSFSQSYSYILKPKNKGELIISPANINIDGKTIESNPIKIIVLDDVNITEVTLKNNIYVKTFISNLHPKINEKITVEYSLYMSEILNVFDLEIDENKIHESFDVKEIKTKINIKDTVFDNVGKRYRYTVFKKIELTPRKVGDFHITPLKVKVNLGVPNGSFDFFSNPTYDQIVKVLTTDKKEINIRK